MSPPSMRSTQETLLEDGNSVNPASLMESAKLDMPLSMLPSKADIIQGSPPPPSAPDPDSDADIYISSQPGHSPSTESSGTVSEIIVRVDDTESDMAGSPISPATSSQDQAVSLSSHRVPAVTGQEKSRKSFASSASALTDHSELSSLPSTPSSKGTTPMHVDAESKELAGILSQPSIVDTSSRAAKPTTPSLSGRKTFDVRPRVSIPTDVALYDYAHQCIAAAEHSRLNPYALHQEEYQMLREHISHAQVTTYLNIRNGILRIWLHNPRIGVAREEAIGCAKDSRWFDAANVCYEWLLRRGYINYGCAEPPAPTKRPRARETTRPAKTVLVIGAGMSGLGCARQLDSLSRQYAEQFQELGEDPPRVIVLEGRSRLGGRVYSRVLDGSQSQRLIGFKGKRHSVECGGMIITGFERGNPLNVLVRGQMALPYYALRPETTLYDANGKAVDANRDLLVEKLYNDCLERVSDYKFKNLPSKLIEGNKGLMDEGKDSASEGHKTIAEVEDMTATMPQAPAVSEQSLGPQVNLVPVSTDRTTGKPHVAPGTATPVKAAYKAKQMGWTLKDGVDQDRDLHLDSHAKIPGATLGSLMDEAITQYRDITDLTAQDFRLMNWHIANLEYSNATNYNQLSLGGWDIDAGNEWEGKHTMVVGGYHTVPCGLAKFPSKLDVRKNCAVRKVTYNPDNQGSAKVQCEDGTVIEADHVVSTIPLGVLKHGSVEFDPPLPSWKSDAIDRLGFGILNKVILVYNQAFWDTSRDIFGVLRSPTSRHSLKQADYTSKRGRCFQWFNVSNTSGIPVLIALMAGDAGFDTEHSSNEDLVAEATEVLRSVYGGKVPQPVQAIVTRWGSDKFARGAYSSAGPSMRPDDYDTMARSVGNLHFAGEHTTGTHPATVHGAYLSGLRVASEVLDSMLGPIEVPNPLIIPRESPMPTNPSGSKRKPPADDKTPPYLKPSRQRRFDTQQTAAWDYVVSQIGERPWRPQKFAGNAYMLYSKVYFQEARQRCEEGRRSGKTRATPNEVRVMTSRMWKAETAERRKPFEDEAAEQKRAYGEILKKWEQSVQEWDQKALEVRAAWEIEASKLSLA